MKRLLLACAATAALTTGAFAETVGVSMSELDNFLTVLRNGIADYAKEKGVDAQIEVAEKDPAKQLSQIQNFIASGVDAIIVNPVDTDATAAQTKLAADAGIPLVYVNRQPVNLDSLPDNQTFVGSDERDSGTLEAKEVCRLLKEKGKGGGANIVVMMGQLNNQAARQRTQDVHDVIATPECSFMKIVEEQTANWYRTEAADLMTNWLSAGVKFDAFVSNNDEMAIGGIQAMKAAGLSMADIVVGGVDATQDALAAMQAGDLDVTVFQNAAAQGSGAVDAALRLKKGEKLGKVVWIPFELVTPANIDNYLKKN
jgi:inositol transport system substrate-binding protein